MGEGYKRQLQVQKVTVEIPSARKLDTCDAIATECQGMRFPAWHPLHQL